MIFPYAAETDRDWEFTQERAWAVYSLLAILLLVHLAVARLPEERQVDVIYRFGAVRCALHAYSLITCAFLHGGWLHLIGNGYFLWIYGVTLEKLLGGGRFLLLYAAGAIVSMLVHFATLSPFVMDIPTIGASGAISAVLGAFFVLLPTARLRCAVVFFLRPILGSLPAWAVLGIWFLGQLYQSLDPQAASASVAFWAHVAGFAAGAGLGTLLDSLRVRRRRHHEEASHHFLDEAWQAFTAGNLTRAATCHARFLDESPEAAHRDSPLLAGLLAWHHDHDANRAAQGLLRAFKRAGNALDHVRQLSVYMQMRRHLPPDSIPPFAHRDGAAAAIACGQPALGVEAAGAALGEGLDERSREQTLARSEAALRHKLGLADAADGVRALLDRHFPGHDLRRAAAGQPPA
ncbi:MAG: Rhomboid protease GluP [Lentisphaerae bacterium ADurb.BinA184]|nr:MAG: Rhomboid protease GluP [Lentisphaerae bacterium ADurb.BinA184]